MIQLVNYKDMTLSLLFNLGGGPYLPAGASSGSMVVTLFHPGCVLSWPCMTSPIRIPGSWANLLLGRPVIRLTQVRFMNQRANWGKSLIVWKRGGTATKTASTCRVYVHLDRANTRLECAYLAVREGGNLIAVGNGTSNFDDWYPVRGRYDDDGHEMYERVVSPHSHPALYQWV